MIPLPYLHAPCLRPLFLLPTLPLLYYVSVTLHLKPNLVEEDWWKGFICPVHHPLPHGAVDIKSTTPMHPIDYQVNTLTFYLWWCEHMQDDWWTTQENQDMAAKHKEVTRCTITNVTHSMKQLWHYMHTRTTFWSPQSNASNSSMAPCHSNWLEQKWPGQKNTQINNPGTQKDTHKQLDANRHRFARCSRNQTSQQRG